MALEQVGNSFRRDKEKVKAALTPAERRRCKLSKREQMLRLEAAVQRAHEKSPEERRQSVREFMAVFGGGEYR